MKKTWRNLFVATAFLSALSVSAQEVQRSEAEAEGREDESKVGITNFALRPHAGAVFFNGTERFAGGVLMDVNVVSLPWMKIGPATGAIYSATGGGSDFFDGVSTDNDEYFFQIPANLKVTFSPDPANKLQLGVHGGANIIRSTQAIGAFGGTDDPIDVTDSGATWDAHPNVGGDIDFALGDNVDLTLRPDVTFLTDFNLVTTTLGLGIKL